MATPAVVHLRDTRANQPAAAVGNAGVLYCVTDEGDIIERSNGTTWESYSPASVDESSVAITGGSITNLSTLELPVSATPTVANDGEIALDTTVADFSHGLIRVFGGEELGVVVMPIAEFTTPIDGHVVAYNATNDEFELVAAAGGGDVTAASNLTDNAIVRGDGGVKGVQTSSVLIDDSNNVSGIVTLSATTIELGHASDTTLSRTGAGDIAVEGNAIYRAGGTDVPLADGGTGSSLSDPNADRILFWDDSAGAMEWLTPGNGLTISGTTITSSDLGVIHCYEEQPSGTDGGSSVAAWTTRVLNTTKSNTISSASLSSNQISLPAGTYDIHARVPCFANASSTGFKARLYDATAAATLIDGTSSWASANAEMSCFVQGRFTLSGTSNVRIEMIATAVRTSGWGVNAAISSVPNHFTDVVIRRIA